MDHAVIDTLAPAILLLGLGILAALAASAARLSPIVGYLALGLALAATGQAERFEGAIVETLAEAGVMFLLFNLGLHFSLSTIRAEAANIFGFGALQMLVSGGGFAALALLLGLDWPIALVTGATLGLSSTAVVIGLIRARGQEGCPVGRAAQSILIFQDIAAIALLVVAGAMGGEGEAPLGMLLAVAGAKALAAFAVAVLFSRVATAPLFRLIARARSGEVFTATALFLALAAGWATGAIGLSLTLGAFLGGMAIADSPYRVVVQSEIEAFRGLFLGFFFMTVGLSLDPGVLAARWPMVIAAAAALIAVKCALNIAAGLVNRWSVPGSVQLGFLLGQGSEFALVIFSLPAIAALLGAEAVSILVAAVALSLACTGAVSSLGRSLAGKLRGSAPGDAPAGDDAAVVVFGLGPRGRALIDGLDRRGVASVAVESDAGLLERAVADGYRAQLASPGDPRTWEPLDMARREVIVVTHPDLSLAEELRPVLEQAHGGLTRIVALGEDGDHDGFRRAGMLPVAAHGTDGNARLLDAVLGALGARAAEIAA